MKLIICVDKKNGLMFGGKRQSQDSFLREKIKAISAGSILWMSEYSAEQFEDVNDICIDNDFVSKANIDDYCFVEDKDFNIETVNEFIVCKWNRQYPADKYLEIDLKSNNFKKNSTENIVGSSHDKITIERYIRDEESQK